jgi:hypothetical protein
MSMLLGLVAPVMSSPDVQRDVQLEQKALQDARLKALRKVFREQPGSQQLLESASGYAVFAPVGLDLGLVSSRRIGGILRLNRSGRDSYYTLLPGPGGDAAAAAGLVAILVFQSDTAFNQFEADGWRFSAQPESVLTEIPETTIYLLTGTPASLVEASVAADSELN